MENASKALIMAGSILLAILVVSLLVFGYSQISEWQQTESDSDTNTKLLEYMQKFEQFNRNASNPIYGSEFLSLVNLQEDYEREKVKGYTPVTITVNITKPITYGEYFNVSGSLDLKNDVAPIVDAIESRIADYDKPNKDYNNKSVKYYSGRTNREIARDFKDELEDNGYVINGSTPSYEVDNILRSFSETAPLMTEIDEYKLLDAEYVEFQKKYFYCESIEYNDQNSRIEKMVIHEV